MRKFEYQHISDEAEAFIKKNFSNSKYFMYGIDVIFHEANVEISVVSKKNRADKVNSTWVSYPHLDFDIKDATRNGAKGGLIRRNILFVAKNYMDPETHEKFYPCPNSCNAGEYSDALDKIGRMRVGE